MGFILLITIVLIVYGSLYPFHFHPSPARPLWVLFHSWPAALDRFEIRDIAINILIYIPIGLFGALWFGRGKARCLPPVLTIVLAAALSLSMELCQLFDARRQASFFDVLTNVAGACIGVLLARLYGRTLLRILARRGARSVAHRSGTILLLLCWFSFQTYPWFPHVGLYAIRAKLAVLGSNFAVPGVGTIGTVVDWLAVAQLLEAAAGAEAAWLLPLLMALIPARILIVGRTFTWAELTAAVAGWALWTMWLRRYSKRAGLLAWLAAILLSMRGLAPFHWAGKVNSFVWIPFAGLLESNWDSAALVLLDKSFLYGTAVWLFRKAGYSHTWATAGLAALLASIEAAQVYLPGRTAEITDPILLLIMSVLLKLLDMSDEGRAQLWPERRVRIHATVSRKPS